MNCKNCGKPLLDPNQPCPHCQTVVMNPVTPVSPVAPQVTQRVSWSGEVIEVEEGHYSPYAPEKTAMGEERGLNSPGLGRIGQSSMAPPVVAAPYEPVALPVPPEVRTTRTVFAVLAGIAALAFAGIFLYTNALKQNQVHALATQLRTLQVGDEWDYKIRVNASLAKGSIDRDGKATSILKVERTNAAPNNDLTLTHTLRINLAKKRNLLEQSFFSQRKPDGILYKSGELDETEKPHFAQQPQPFLPGKWQDGLEFKTQTEYGDGVRETTEWKIVGSEIVDTPAGRFATWKVEERTERTATNPLLPEGLQTSTKWFAPQLGSFVKGTTRQTLLGLITLTLDFSLQKTNVPDYHIVSADSVKPTIKSEKSD